MGGRELKKSSGKEPWIYWKEAVAGAGPVLRATAFSKFHMRKVLPGQTSARLSSENEAKIQKGIKHKTGFKTQIML
jgi:hypothetical protein